MKLKEIQVDLGEGNTNSSPVVTEMSKNKQISPAKNWCFTLNNWNEIQYEEIFKNIRKYCEYSIVAKEIGEQGTPHLQGFCIFKIKCRPINKIGIKEIHWEKCRGNKLDNQIYCKKDGDYKEYPEPFKKIIDNLYDWQQKVMDLISKEPDDRSIIWIYENEGNVGKTALVKHILSTKSNVLPLSGKGIDIKNAVLQYYTTYNKTPEIIIIDIPRVVEHIAYGSIEEIKNMMFYSGKYEGGVVFGECPHLIIFSNKTPDIDIYSKDRWNIFEIKDKKLIKISLY